MKYDLNHNKMTAIVKNNSLGEIILFISIHLIKTKLNIIVTRLDYTYFVEKINTIHKLFISLLKSGMHSIMYRIKNNMIYAQKSPI